MILLCIRDNLPNVDKIEERCHHSVDKFNFESTISLKYHTKKLISFRIKSRNIATLMHYSHEKCRAPAIEKFNFTNFLWSSLFTNTYVKTCICLHYIFIRIVSPCFVWTMHEMFSVLCIIKWCKNKNGKEPILSGNKNVIQFYKRDTNIVYFLIVISFPLVS